MQQNISRNIWRNAGLVLACIMVSAPASAESLEEALVSAYSGNPTLLAQRAKLRSVDELVPQALSNWRPTIKLTGSAGRSLTSTNALPATKEDSVYSPRSYGVMLSQPLYRGGRTVAQTKQADATVASQRALLAATEQAVLLNAAQAYLDVVKGQAVVALQKNQEAVVQRQLDATRDRFRVGELTRTDVSQAETRLSGAHAERVLADGNLRTAVANYTAVVGHAPVALSQPSGLGVLPVSLDDAVEQSLASNPNVISAQHSWDAAFYGVELIEGDLRPEVSCDTSYTRTLDYSGTNVFRRVGLAAVNVTVPIYQKGQEFSRIRQQKHVAGQARTELDATRRDTVDALTRYWETLLAARANVASYQDQIKSASIALEGVQHEAQVGSRTVLDILNAEQELLNAKVNLVSAQHDEALGVYQVKSALGQMTAQALDLPIEIYDPLKHYDDVREQWIGTDISPVYGDEIK